MSSKGRVEYAQTIGGDWQVSTAALSVALVVVGLVAMFYQASPATNSDGSVRSAVDRLGQLRSPTQAPLQRGVGSTQGGINTQRGAGSLNSAGGGLQAAGSADVFEQFERGSL